MMQRKVDGYIKDQRIYCNHCNKVVSLFLSFKLFLQVHRTFYKIINIFCGIFRLAHQHLKLMRVRDQGANRKSLCSCVQIMPTQGYLG
jgi:hypothetical protein